MTKLRGQKEKGGRSKSTHRYFKYRPENWVWAMTSILPSGCWLISTVSPRFPTRLSTLILSCRNFSNAETSKILSEAGWEALIIYCELHTKRPSAQKADLCPTEFGETKDMYDGYDVRAFLVILACLPLVPERVLFCAWRTRVTT